MDLVGQTHVPGLIYMIHYESFKCTYLASGLGKAPARALAGDVEDNFRNESSNL